MKNVHSLQQKNKYFPDTFNGELQGGKRSKTEVVARWKEDGGNLIGIRYDKKGLIISIGCVANDTMMKGDIYQLLSNAVRYSKRK